MRLVSIATMALVVSLATDARGEAEPLVEEAAEKSISWTLALFGGGAFPLGDYADSREFGLAARGALSLLHRSGVGLGLSAGYSPLPGENLDHHVGDAALTPRFTLGRGALRLYVAGGGALVYQRSIEPATEESPSQTTTVSEAAARAEAGLELHFADAGGISISALYTRGVGDAKTELATAQAGFVLAF